MTLPPIAGHFLRRCVCTAGLALLGVHSTAAAITPHFQITFASSAHAGPITGRLVLAISKMREPEPRLLISPRGPALFAIDLDQLRPGQPATIDQSSLGYPSPLADLPPGDYFAQAVINVYEQVHRADGKTVWLHMNDGTVEFFSNAAGQSLQRRHADPCRR